MADFTTLAIEKSIHLRCAVAIFAKTIGFSDVKTRLAADIGKEKAEAFYRLSIDCVQAFVAEAGEAFPEVIYPVWVVAEESGPDYWKDRTFPAIWTGEGGLGARLANVSEHLFETYDAVMMIGTDSPQLSPTVIVDAVARLAGGASEVVTGPAEDGGFYLFASRERIAREVWEAVAYSNESTLAQLVEFLEHQTFKIDYLETAQDVDTLDDLQTLQTVLSENLNQLNTEQSMLLKWLNENSDLF